MEQYVIDSLKRNQEEIDDLKNNTEMDKDFKEKLMNILYKEKDMLKNLENYYNKKDETTSRDI
jgi:hypothetical protein